jgi:hypothetical protein
MCSSLGMLGGVLSTRINCQSFQRKLLYVLHGSFLGAMCTVYATCSTDTNRHSPIIHGLPLAVNVITGAVCCLSSSPRAYAAVSC